MASGKGCFSLSLRNHPPEALLFGFAAGELPLAPSIVVSAHAETCTMCGARIRALEEAEGRLLEATLPASMTDGALERMLDRLDETSTPDELQSGQSDLGGISIPEAAARAGLGSRRWLAPGFWAAPVRAPQVDGWRTFLLRAPAGVTVPMHCHRGGELIAVLLGSFQDGRSFVAGDFAENVAGSEHHLKVGADGPCACLVSVQGPLQWRGWAKMITPLMGL